MSVNVTEEDYWFPSLSDKIAITVIFGSIIVTGVVGNILILAVIFLVKKMRSAVNLCLASLALTDLLVLLFLPIAPLVSMFDLDDSYMGPYLCVFMGAMDRGTIVCSIFIFILIAAERYTVLCRPLKSIGMWTIPKICGLLLLIWLIAVGVSVPFGYRPFVISCGMNHG